MDAVSAVGPTVATDYPWDDLFRLGLILVPGIIVLGIALVVLLRYLAAWWTDRALAEAQGVKSKWRGLLPVHVITIAASYIGLVMMLLTSAVGRFREPLYSWERSICYSIFLWLGVWALYTVIAHQRLKMQSIKSVSYPKATQPGHGPAPLRDDNAP